MPLFLLSIFLLLPVQALTQPITENSQFVCSAPSNDVIPCESNTPFSPITEPDLDQGISNPINLITGEKFLKEIDLPESIFGSLPPFMRFYRSSNQQISTMGLGWLNIYEIKAEYQGNNQWLIRFANGETFSFYANKSKNITWLGANGRSLSFNEAGKLTKISDPKLGLISLDYHTNGMFKGYLQQISTGKVALKLDYNVIYGQVLISKMDTPLGTFDYHYDSNLRLVKVQRPDGMARHYHYEPKLQSGHKNLITGISFSDQQGKNWRARTWLYDEQAKVIQAYPNNNESDSLKLKYANPSNKSQTEVSSSLGSSIINYKNINGRLKITSRQTKTTAITAKQIFNYGQNNNLESIDNMTIGRYKDGNIKNLSLINSGWPDLKLNYNNNGQLNNWFSKLTNLTKYNYHENGQLQGIQYANGDQLDISPDFAGRPVILNYTGINKTSITVKLGWQGSNLNYLQHPNETEQLEFNRQQQITGKTVERHNVIPIRYSEKFSYLPNGNLSQHTLPEQGKLIYQWSEHNIKSIGWLDNKQKFHPVITTDQLAGYTYGNGLKLQILHNKFKSSLLLTYKEDIFWGEARLNNAAGKIIKQATLDKSGNQINYRFAYDEFNRTIAITSNNNKTAISKFIAWHKDGSLYRQTYTDSHINRDKSGLPTNINKYKLNYQAQQRLATVQVNNKTIANYGYNAKGQRIYQDYGKEFAHRLYLDNKLVAIWSFKNGIATIKQRFIYAHGIAVGLIETNSQGHSKLYYIHNNQIGAPVLVTDEDRNIVWQADYDLFGNATITTKHINLPLRLPGQDVDQATGWHDNVFRTYLPTLGQYLEPDPLGPLPGQQALGYAAQQPQSLTDPLGLILLAFDGTNNSSANQSNIWKLSRSYAGPSYYHQGPGSSFNLTWDAITAASGKQIQANQWQSLLDGIQISKNQGLSSATIDLLGYSRGAALARDFANQIIANTKSNWFSYDDPIRGNISICIDLRFMGLFDTVAQFGIINSANPNYNLRISDAWLWVAHAVAANEYRALFPLVSVMAEGNTNTIEIPFIGAHADIGGGMLLDSDTYGIENGDLSDVALNWMFWQANAALLPLNELIVSDRTVTNPLLHDERTTISDAIFQDDRFIQDSQTNIISHQGDDPNLGQQQRDLFERFINRITSNTNVAGEIDMQAYNNWLQENYGMPSVYN